MGVMGIKQITKNFFLFIFLILGISSCANLSKNRIYQGSFILSNGQVTEKYWKEDLEFKRSSWYFELTMYFDIMIGQLKEDSGFNNWMTETERLALNSCVEKYITLSYRLDSDKISDKSFFAQMEKQGLTQIILPDFGNQVKLHPDFERLGLREYNVYFLCRRGPGSGNPIKVNFPSFKEGIIN